MESKLLRLLTIAFIFVANVAFAQSKEINGIVYDENQQPLPGANVVVKGTTNGTTADFDGNFIIQANEGDILEATFMGYSLKSIRVDSKSTYSINLSVDLETLDEVIVVAYGTAKKESFTGSAGVVTTKNLEQRTISSVTQALEGSTTGLQVTSGSGQPGSAPDIRIRGFGTLNGSADPLYIVDGAQFEGTLASISPDDIQSMTILKDASSTALYGARAANGVIMITTKQGKNNQGEIDIQFKAVAGVINRALPYYETVNAKNYYELQGESYKNSLIHSEGFSPEDAAAKAYTDIFDRLKYNPFNVANDQILGADGKINPNASTVFPDLNWYDPLEQVGYRQNYNVSASGGGEKHNYFFSVGYLDESGYMKKSDYNRINTRINLNMTPKKWLKLGTNFSGSMSSQGLASTSTSNSGYSNPFNVARNMGPIYPVHIVDPQTGSYILDAGGNKQYDLGEGYSEYGINARPAGANNGRHVIAELDYNNNVTLVNNLSNRSFAEFKIMEGLSVTFNGSVDINNYKDEEFENPTVGDGAPAGRYNETRYTRTVTNFNQLVNYTKTFAEDHTISVLLGHESFTRKYTSMYGMKTQQIVDGIYEFDNFVTPTSLTGSTTDKVNEGYFSNLKYDYKNKYYFSGSYRYDGSSVFHPDVRWGGFYSIGASWRITQEEFMDDVEWLSSLKLRASYGEVGNDNLAGDYYAYQALYGTRPNGGTPGLDPSSLGNDLLTWESNKSSDIGVEFGLFEGRLTGSVEYYNKVSEDLLFYLPVSPSVGLEEQPKNIATLVNSGWEIGLNGEIIKQNGFRWNLGVQASTVKNEITSIPTPFVSGSKRWQEGHSIYDYFLYDYYGVDDATGAPLYQVWEEGENGETYKKYDADGNPVLTEDYTKANKGYTGDSSIPTLFGSITNSLSYKGFQLDVFMTYSIGGKILDDNYRGLMNEGIYGKNMHVDQLNAWRQPGDNTDVPRLENGNDNINPTSSRWLTDASYFTLKNVNFSYNFDKAALDKMGVSSLRLTLTGENLIMTSARTGMNPQQAFSGVTSNVYLPSRVFSFGVNVGF